MNLLKRALTMVLFLTAMNSNAQNLTAEVETSGAGNGSLSKDVLNYESELKESITELETLEDKFKKLAEALSSLSTTSIPTLDPIPSDFWDEITDKDVELLKALDQGLINMLQAAVTNIYKLKQKVVDEAAVLNELEKNDIEFKKKGIDDYAKKKIKDKRFRLHLYVEENLGSISESILLHRYYGTTIEEKARLRFIDHNFMSCERPTCLDLISDKLIKFNNASTDFLKSTSVTLIGKNYKSLFKLTAFHNYVFTYWHLYKTTSVYKKDFRDYIENYYKGRVLMLTENYVRESASK